MTLKFRPMPGMTIAVVICLVILIGLGNWQYRRLIWKADLIRTIDIAANAPALNALADIQSAIDLGEPIEFRRISIHGEFKVPRLNQGHPFHLMRSSGKALTWRFYQPLHDGAIHDPRRAAYIASREFTDVQKTNPPKPLLGARTVIGYVRTIQKPNMVTPKSTISTNRWFAFNALPDQLDWSGNGEFDMAYYIDWVEHIDDVKNLPVRIPHIANNHLDYMLTWYSFAIILLVIYLILHQRAGRLWVKRE